MRALILATLLLLSMGEGGRFTAKLNSSHGKLFIHYPEQTEKLKWMSVCVFTVGRDSKENSVAWEAKSCWEPRFLTEEFTLKNGAIQTVAMLMVKIDGVIDTMYSARLQVRPEETP